MKISIQSNNLLRATKRHFELEADQVVMNGQADLIITDQDISYDRTPIVGGILDLPLPVLQALGYEVSSEILESYFFTKWYDKFNGWDQRLFVGIPLNSLMAHDMGYGCQSGVAGRFIHSEQAERLIQNQDLEEYLRDIHYTGFVSFLMSHDHKVIGIMSWSPSTGMFNVFEGVRDKLSEFLSNPSSSRVYESWTVSLLISRYPYPHKMKARKENIFGVTRSAERHLWLYEVDAFGQVLSTESSIVGVVSTWGQSLNEAARRARSGVLKIQIPMMQVRLDAEHAILSRWDSVKTRWLDNTSSHDR